MRELNVPFEDFKIEIQNWRSINSLSINDITAPLVVVHGPNGSGKTSVLEAIRFGFLLTSFPRSLATCVRNRADPGGKVHAVQGSVSRSGSNVSWTNFIFEDATGDRSVDPLSQIRIAGTPFKEPRPAQGEETQGSVIDNSSSGIDVAVNAMALLPTLVRAWLDDDDDSCTGRRIAIRRMLAGQDAISQLDRAIEILRRFEKINTELEKQIHDIIEISKLARSSDPSDWNDYTNKLYHDIREQILRLENEKESGVPELIVEYGNEIASFIHPTKSFQGITLFSEPNPEAFIFFLDKFLVACQEVIDNNFQNGLDYVVASYRDDWLARHQRLSAIVTRARERIPGILALASIKRGGKNGSKSLPDVYIECIEENNRNIQLYRQKVKDISCAINEFLSEELNAIYPFISRAVQILGYQSLGFKPIISYSLDGAPFVRIVRRQLTGGQQPQPGSHKPWLMSTFGHASAGERYSLALAVFLARAVADPHRGTFLLDEPFLHLDGMARAGAMDLLRAIALQPKNNKRFFITTADDIVLDHLIEKCAAVREMSGESGRPERPFLQVIRLQNTTGQTTLMFSDEPETYGRVFPCSGYPSGFAK